MIDIQKLLTLPESRTLEFKRDASSLKPILKTLIAFANTAGGTLLIGRDNNGTVVGVEDIFETEEKIANAISDCIYPPLMPEIETTSIEGKSLVVIRVAHWRGPFYLKEKGPENGVYIRLGSTNRAAGPDILEELKRSITKVSFDQLPCIEAHIDSLDMQLVEQAFTTVGKKIGTSELETLGILVPYNGNLVCSNGGIILFGKENIRKQLFPNSIVRCARFRGTDKVDFIDQYEVQGTIIDAMEEVPKFIKRNTRLAAKIEKMQRDNIPEYSPIVIREVLTNALVHADYTILGKNPRISIFSDRLEIESPGMLPFGYTLKDFISGVSHIRNKVIARVFRELNLMEEWGTGYKRITQACRIGGYENPQWHELGTTIRVSLTPHEATLEEITSKQKKASGELTTRQQRILTICNEKYPISAIEIFYLLGKGITERTVRNDLSKLRTMGLIKMIGKGPNATWEPVFNPPQGND